MKIKERIAVWKFNRDLKKAQRRFLKVTKSSIYWRYQKALERRQLIKDILRGAGFKNIRLKERANLKNLRAKIYGEVNK